MSARETARKLLSNEKYHLAALDGTRSQQVASFHDFYGAPIADEPSPTASHMSDERIGLRLGLIVEEVQELLQDGFGIKTDITYDVGTDEIFDDITTAVKASSQRNTVGAADALGDISYVVDGFALELGFNLDEVIDEIHASNMTKAGEDGKPIYREDGKVLKGPFYTKPNIEKVIFNAS